VRFSLIPRNYRFYDLFEKSAHNLVAAGEQLLDLMEHYENVEMKTAHMKELERAGDGIIHEIMEQLHKTFVTPLDREDMTALAQHMDDVVDSVEGASTAMRIYGIQRPTAAARGLADLIRLQTVQVERAVMKLRHRSQLKGMLEQTVEVHRLENAADALFLDAMAELFVDEARPVEIIKWREIYDQLEQATDSAEDVCTVLEGIVLKHA
jgi:predicted phosphate transport protein (TIGR00153 family)